MTTGPFLYDDDPAGEIPPGNYTGVPVLSDAEWKTRDPEDVSDAIEPQKYEAKHRGRGSFSVLHNGVEVVEA